MSRMEEGPDSLLGLIRIANELPGLKRDIKALRLDILDLIGQRDRATNALYLVVNAVNRSLPYAEIKRIAVRGMKRSKPRRTL